MRDKVGAFLHFCVDDVLWQKENERGSSVRPRRPPPDRPRPGLWDDGAEASNRGSPSGNAAKETEGERNPASVDDHEAKSIALLNLGAHPNPIGPWGRSRTLPRRTLYRSPP